jgi:hypothetical protein
MIDAVLPILAKISMIGFGVVLLVACIMIWVIGHSDSARKEK